MKDNTNLLMAQEIILNHLLWKNVRQINNKYKKIDQKCEGTAREIDRKEEGGKMPCFL